MLPKMSSKERRIQTAIVALNILNAFSHEKEMLDLFFVSFVFLEYLRTQLQLYLSPWHLGKFCKMLQISCLSKCFKCCEMWLKRRNAKDDSCGPFINFCSKLKLVKRETVIFIELKSSIITIFMSSCHFVHHVRQFYQNCKSSRPHH